MNLSVLPYAYCVIRITLHITKITPLYIWKRLCDGEKRIGLNYPCFLLRLFGMLGKCRDAYLFVFLKKNIFGFELGLVGFLKGFSRIFYAICLYISHGEILLNPF
jgi:hypothetical protein